MNDLGKAFSFPFKDPAWGSKFFLAAVFMLLSIVLVGIFILAGYFVQVTQRVMRREVNPMPEWTDIGVKLVLGFKFCVVYFVYIFPVLLLYIPFVVIIMVGAVSGDQETIGAVAGLYSVLIVVLIIPYSLALALLAPSITVRFAEHERISDGLDIGGIFRNFKQNWQNHTIVALIAVGLQSFAGIGFILFIVGIFVTIFYSYLVSAHMYGSLYLEQAREGTPA
jgi:hypothetical protein